MPSLRTAFRLLLFVVLVTLAPRTAHAQNDPTKIAAEAQKQLSDIQKQLAAGTELQKRFRIDKFEANEQQVKIVGVFLEPALADEQQVPFADLQAEAGKLLRTQLKDDALKFDWSGVAKIAAKDQPHVVLQLAANAAAEKGEAVADQFKFEPSRFGADGSLILAGIRSKDEAATKWLASAVTTILSKNPAVKVVNQKPLVTDELKATEWKLTPLTVQTLFAASTQPAIRRLRVDRAWLAFDADNLDAASRWNTLYFTVAGVRLGEDAVDAEEIANVCRKHWPELFAGTPRVLVNLKPLLGPGIPEPNAKWQAAVAARPSLDGVRIDAGAEFTATGKLAFAGVQPGLTANGEKELNELHQAVLKEFIDKGDAAAARYKRFANGGISTTRMKVIPTGKMLADLRTWATNTLDDVLLSRLYFSAQGTLQLQVKTATKPDADKVQIKLKELTAKFFGTDPKDPDAIVPGSEHSLFAAALTTHLRKEMAGDQKRWNGVLIERGHFDATGHFTLRGVVDSAAQNDALAKLFDQLKTEMRWAEYFATPATKPALDVVPMSDLLERVKRVTPGYAAFDGIRIESARYDANVNLVFDARTAVKLDSESAALLAKLLRESDTYKRRIPPDRQIKIEKIAGDTTQSSDDVGRISVATGAQLLAGDNLEKAKTWIDSATLHYPNEAGVWFLSAYYHYLKGDDELVRRDLFRMIELEGPLAANASAQRKRRYEATKNLQGTKRNELETLALDYFRESKEGGKPITMTPPPPKKKK